MENDYCPLPPKVAAAIVAIMADVPKLDKTARNTHGQYNFASIDGFLEAVRPLCAKHGLIISQDEEGFEVRDFTTAGGKAQSWLVMKFRYTMAHQSGEVWNHRPTRSIMVLASMGAQAFGAAQSYSLKQFMRSMFQIATGETGQDADEHPPGDLPSSTDAFLDGAVKGKTAAPPPPPAPKKDTLAAWKGPLGKVDLKKKMRELVADLALCEDETMLESCLSGYQGAIEQLKIDEPMLWDGEAHDGFQPLKARIEMKRAELITR